jgi:hypothetical protein
MNSGFHGGILNNGFNRGFNNRFNRGFNRGFGRGFNDHDFDDFPFRCFGCGFNFGFFPSFGFGFGWGWGWGGWWNPWWWGPSPGWSWAPPPPPAPVSGDFSLYYGNSKSAYNAPNSNPSTSYGSSDSFNASLNSEPVGSPNPNSVTGNVAQSTPTVLLYLKDGTMYTASDYWLVDNKLHYVTSYSTESILDMDEVDLQRTVNENAKRAVRFTLKPNPNGPTAAPAPNSNGAQSSGTASSNPSNGPDTNGGGATPATSPAPTPVPARQAQETSQSQT